MQVNKRWAVAGFFVLLIAVGAGFAWLSTNSSSTPPPDASGTATSNSGAQLPAFDWAVTAAGGSLVGADSNQLALTLSGVDPVVTRFTKSPAREAFAVDVRDFLIRWDDRFLQTNPNAAVTYSQAAGQTPVTIVVTLSKPRYVETTRTLVFDAVRLNQEPDMFEGTKFPIAPPEIVNPASTGPVSVFID